MGMDLWVGGKQFRVTNYYFYNEFLNYVSKMGNFPQILDHSPTSGAYSLTTVRASRYNGSIEKLKGELEKLRGMNPPDYAEHVITEMLRACDLALETKQKITLEEVR